MKRLTLAAIIGILASAERQGLPEDNPEGSRYVQLSDTLVSNISSSLTQHQEEHAAMTKQLEQSAQASLTASRQAIVDKVLASEEWESGDADIDAEFRADALAAAVNAEDDEKAEQAVLKVTGKQQKLLGLAKNTPGIGAASDPLGQKKLTAEQQQQIEQAQREAGLN